MSDRPFSITDHTTWPEVMSVPEVAAIYRKTPGGLKKACWRHKFIPAPYRTDPFQWRKVDVLRDTQGSRQTSFRKVG